MLTVQEVEDAWARSVTIPPGDVVYARMEYPFRKTFYPLGFPVEISSNEPAVILAAAQIWGQFHPMFNIVPIQIQVGVLEGSSDILPPAPICRVQQHIFSFVADRENYGTIDLARGFSSLWLTQRAVQNTGYLRHFFLECAAICHIASQHTTGVHSGCVSHYGAGVLLCGDSGAGKSTLSYACAKAGFTYITDDGSYLLHDREKLVAVGNCHQIRFRPATATLFPEINGPPVTQRAEVGKPSIELSPVNLPDIHYSQSAEVRYVVLLNRRNNVNEPLRPYSKEVVRQFLRQGRFSPPEMMPIHYATIDRLLQTEVLELRYRDLEWAVEQLKVLTAGERS